VLVIVLMALASVALAVFGVGGNERRRVGVRLAAFGLFVGSVVSGFQLRRIEHDLDKARDEARSAREDERMARARLNGKLDVLAQVSARTFDALTTPGADVESLRAELKDQMTKLIREATGSRRLIAVEQLTQELKTAGPPGKVVVWGNTGGEIQHFAGFFLRAFSDAGWTARGPLVDERNPYPDGVGLLLTPKYSPKEEQLRALLVEHGADVHLVPRDEPAINNLGDNDVAIVIGER
jgi:hypothetical protein